MIVRVVGENVKNLIKSEEIEIETDDSDSPFPEKNIWVELRVSKKRIRIKRDDLIKALQSMGNGKRYDISISEISTFYWLYCSRCCEHISVNALMMGKSGLVDMAKNQGWSGIDVGPVLCGRCFKRSCLYDE